MNELIAKKLYNTLFNLDTFNSTLKIMGKKRVSNKTEAIYTISVSKNLQSRIIYMIKNRIASNKESINTVIAEEALSQGLKDSFINEYNKEIQKYEKLLAVANRMEV